MSDVIKRKPAGNQVTSINGTKRGDQPVLNRGGTGSFVIRQATSDDAEEVYALMLELAVQQDQEEYLITDIVEFKKSGFNEDPKFGLLVAVYEGTMIGYVSYTLAYSIWLGSSRMHIDDVYVKEAFRNKNYGTAMLIKAGELCKELGIKSLRWQVEVDNCHAIRFYENLGAEMQTKGLCTWDVQS